MASLVRIPERNGNGSGVCQDPRGDFFPDAPVTYRPRQAPKKTSARGEKTRRLRISIMEEDGKPIPPRVVERRPGLRRRVVLG
ncbi:MAG TPA: hypothetical protein VG819_13860, partial [Rhizomicrobium sp.]|nr:hypothetical protein [Rhizomicrobium sp.]